MFRADVLLVGINSGTTASLGVAFEVEEEEEEEREGEERSRSNTRGPRDIVGGKGRHHWTVPAWGGTILMPV